MSLLNKLTQVAKSKQGQEMLQKAKTFANDPKTRAKLDEARGKLTDQVDAAKQKMAEKKAKDGSGEPQYGEAGAPGDSPAYGESSEPATQPAAGGQDDAPAAGTDGPTDGSTDGPAYGEESADKPLYGEDGPKAA